MVDESASISSKTWARNVDSINKTGYSDGVIDGQNVSFQSSFDMGYSQGLQFGLELGLKTAVMQQRCKKPMVNSRDSQRINCNICLVGSVLEDNVVNLFNTQKEKNDEHLRLI